MYGLDSLNSSFVDKNSLTGRRARGFVYGKITPLARYLYRSAVCCRLLMNCCEIRTDLGVIQTTNEASDGGIDMGCLIIRKFKVLIRVSLYVMMVRLSSVIG